MLTGSSEVKVLYCIARNFGRKLIWKFGGPSLQPSNNKIFYSHTCVWQSRTQLPAFVNQVKSQGKLWEGSTISKGWMWQDLGKQWTWHALTSSLHGVDKNWRDQGDTNKENDDKPDQTPQLTQETHSPWDTHDVNRIITTANTCNGIADHSNSVPHTRSHVHKPPMVACNTVEGPIMLIRDPPQYGQESTASNHSRSPCYCTINSK